MHRPVRRKDREIGIAEAASLLASASYGVLATTGDNGQAYAVPLSFAFHGNCIYFHCAQEGQKLDNLRANPAVSFCVVGHTKTLLNQFATEYESAVAFGIAEEIHDSEKLDALGLLLQKYSPGFIAQGNKYIAGKFDETVVVRINVNHLSGKARR